MTIEEIRKRLQEKLESIVELKYPKGRSSVSPFGWAILDIMLYGTADKRCVGKTVGQLEGIFERRYKAISNLNDNLNKVIGESNNSISDEQNRINSLNALEYGVVDVRYQHTFCGLGGTLDYSYGWINHSPWFSKIEKGKYVADQPLFRIIKDIASSEELKLLHERKMNKDAFEKLLLKAHDKINTESDKLDLERIELALKELKETPYN